MSKTRIILPLLLCSAFPATLAGQASPDLAQAIRDRDQAIAQGDVTTWERFTAAEFTVVDIAGRLSTRAGHLAEFSPTALSWRAAQPVIYIDGVRLASAGGAAATACEAEHITLLATGRVATRRCLKGGAWWLEVWSKSASGWQAVAVQATAAAK